MLQAELPWGFGREGEPQPQPSPGKVQGRSCSPPLGCGAQPARALWGFALCSHPLGRCCLRALGTEGTGQGEAIWAFKHQLQRVLLPGVLGSPSQPAQCSFCAAAQRRHKAPGAPEGHGAGGNAGLSCCRCCSGALEGFGGMQNPIFRSREVSSDHCLRSPAWAVVRSSGSFALRFGMEPVASYKPQTFAAEVGPGLRAGPGLASLLSLSLLAGPVLPALPSPGCGAFWGCSIPGSAPVPTCTDTRVPASD